MALIKNKQLHFNYEIVETLHAGIVLSGFEVKSLRQGNASLKGSYVIMQDTEAYLVHTYIAPYQANNIPASYDPYQKRKLLLQKKEFTYLAKQKKICWIDGSTSFPLYYTSQQD